MAKLMSYTDPQTGAVYPQSIWLPMFEAADFTSRDLRVVFNGYASPDALLAGKAPIGQYPVTRTGAEMLAFVMSAPVGPTLFDVVSNACYAAVAGDPFFAGAQDVQVSLV